MRLRPATLSLCLLMPLTAVPAAAARKAPAAVSPVPDRCSAITARSFAADVKIVSAKHIPAAAPGIPMHCRVEGVVNERVGAGGKTYGIRFAIALPDDWRGRFLLQGGGGLNGTVNPPLGSTAAGDTPALARGFAVISHDSGHQGAVFDGRFMIDQRANLDFSETAVRRVAELGKAITTAYYGKPIAHSYMAGCSTGGRESMLAAQRYPELFDGIVVGAPAMRTGNSNLGIAYAAVQFNQAAPRDKDGKPIVEQIFSAADRALILKGLLDQCDARDGLKDGMIMNVVQCHFQPARLGCPQGKAETCLSAAQVEAIERAFAGPRDKAGYPLYAAVPYDVGIVDVGGPISGYLPDGRPGVFGPASRDLAIDLDARIDAIRADAGQRLTDTNVWTNLNTFLDRGGKILFYHGVSDPWFSALDTLDYWQRAAKANGAAWTKASRFYMVPGMGHCGGGNAFDTFDLLGAMIDWVEKGQAPEAVPASRQRPVPARRPMCPYPSYAYYVGGDERRAESFECRLPSS